MDERIKKIRTKRAREMNTVLKKLYPQPTIALVYSTDFELLVAVILSAQCTDVRVNQVTPRLFKKYPTVRSYAEARPQDVEKIIYSCGFYKNKTKSIIGAAHVLVERFNATVPKTMDELLSLPGVARKTANVVLSNAFHIHEGIAVDTHVRRFAIRFDLSDYTDPLRIERDLMEIMPQKEWWFFNHRLVHYGRDVCKAYQHDCMSHPLTKIYPKAAHIWPKAH